MRMRCLEGYPPTHEVIYSVEGEEGGDGTVPLWSVKRPDITTYYVNAGHFQLVSAKAVLQATLEMIYGGVPALPRHVPPEGERLRILEELPSLETLAHLVRERFEQGKATVADLERFRFI